MKAHRAPAALAARERFLRRRALLRAAVADALARGYVIDPDNTAVAERGILMNLLLGSRRHRAHLVPVTAEFALEHQDLLDSPHQLWALANQTTQPR